MAWKGARAWQYLLSGRRAAFTWVVNLRGSLERKTHENLRVWRPRVQADLGDVCFVVESGKAEVILDPFDVDDAGKPRTQSAYTARIMLENAVLRRETRQLGRVMDAILMQAKERRKPTLGRFPKRGQSGKGDRNFEDGLEYLRDHWD